jgi:peptidoglycan/xylan/chitin deacetylase (PgdA/CDA1 family)
MRFRWDRLAVLGMFAVMLVLAALNALTGGPPPPAEAAALLPVPPATTSTSAPDPPCPVSRRGTIVRTAPAAASGPETGRSRTVALTFDDGPSRWTPQILQVLRRNRVRATFFMIGSNAENHPDEVAAVAADGHLIAGHTWEHVPPSRGDSWPVSRLGSELDRTNAALEQLTGHPVCWFRPPSGILAGTSGPAAQRGLSVVLWSVDSRDWQVQDGARADPDAVLAWRITVLATAGGSQTHPLVLLHDGGGYRGATVEALPAVIAYYRQRGYAFVRLDGR